jgi:hypothetical protein
MKRPNISTVIGVGAAVGATDMPYTVPKFFYQPWPIDNIDDPTIQELGEWAVSEHVKRTNGRLKFRKVVSGEELQAAATDYWLVIQALNGDGEIGTYKAQVYERVWPKARLLRLDDFGPAN